MAVEVRHVAVRPSWERDKAGDPDPEGTRILNALLADGWTIVETVPLRAPASGALPSSEDVDVLLYCLERQIGRARRAKQRRRGTARAD